MGANNVSPNRHRPIAVVSCHKFAKGEGHSNSDAIEAVAKKTKKSGVFRGRGIIGERRLGVKICHFKVFSP